MMSQRKKLEIKTTIIAITINTRIRQTWRRKKTIRPGSNVDPTCPNHRILNDNAEELQTEHGDQDKGFVE